MGGFIETEYCIKESLINTKEVFIKMKSSTPIVYWLKEWINYIRYHN